MSDWTTVTESRDKPNNDSSTGPSVGHQEVDQNVYCESVNTKHKRRYEQENHQKELENEVPHIGNHGDSMKKIFSAVIRTEPPGVGTLDPSG